MNDTWSTLTLLLPTAIGVAVSPAPVVELILVLFSKRRDVNALAFVVTLLLMTAAALVAGAYGGQAAAGDGAGPSPAVGIVLLVLGGLLLLLAGRNWRNRADTSEPAVLSKIGQMGPAAVAFLAFGAVWVNPKNLVLLLAAGRTVGETSSPVLFGVAFLVVATIPYTAAAAYAVLGGEPAHARLDRMRTTLIARNRTIMAVVLGLMGLLLVVKGAGALL